MWQGIISSHRSRRNGSRCGVAGGVDKRKLLMDIEKLMKCDLPNRVIAGFELDPRIRAEPIINGRSSGPRGITPKLKAVEGVDDCQVSG